MKVIYIFVARYEVFLLCDPSHCNIICCRTFVIGREVLIRAFGGWSEELD